MVRTKRHPSREHRIALIRIQPSSILGLEKQLSRCSACQNRCWCSNHGKRDKTAKFISSVKSQYRLGTIAHGPHSFLFKGLYIVQDTNFMAIIHSDRKRIFNSLSNRPSSSQTSHGTLNAVTLKSFRSLNSSIGWLGMNPSLHCSFHSSYIQ